MTTVNITLNGKAVSADVPDNTLLVNFIRETMALTAPIPAVTPASAVPVLSM